VTKPLLPIPLEKWYLIQTFTTLPVGLAGFLSYSGLAYLLCKAVRGKGDFDQTLASQAFTLHVPTFIFTWIPETFLAPILIINGIDPFPWPDWVENFRVFVLPFIWIFVISTIALSEIHNIRWWKSIIIILISFIPKPELWLSLFDDMMSVSSGLCTCLLCNKIVFCHMPWYLNATELQIVAYPTIK